MSSGNWESNPPSDWLRRIWEAWKPNKYSFLSSMPPDLIITKTTVSSGCKVNVKIVNPGEFYKEPEGEIHNASGPIRLTLNKTEDIRVDNHSSDKFQDSEEVVSVRTAMEQYAFDHARFEAARREWEIREELFAGETPNGNIMDYEVIFVPGRHRTTCVHRAPIADLVVGYSRNNFSEVNITTHAVQLRPLLRFGDVGFCHERKAIYVSSERRYRACDVLVEDREFWEEFDPRRQRLPDIMVMARCSVHDLGINLRVGWLEGTRGVLHARSQARKRLQKACGEQRRWPSFEQEYPAVVRVDRSFLEEVGRVLDAPLDVEDERQRIAALNEHYRRMVDRLSRQEMPRFYGADRSDREPLPQTSKPPISASTCSSCKAENLESFLRAEGKVFCHPCVEKFPPCCFCGNKVVVDGAYFRSKRPGEERVACPPCVEEKKNQKLVKEVAG